MESTNTGQVGLCSDWSQNGESWFAIKMTLVPA